MIFVVVGGGPFYGFNRLVEAMDRFAEKSQDKVVIQKGCSTYEPKYAKAVDFLTFSKYLDLYKRADIIVGHAGAGTVLLSRILKKSLVIVPRSHKKNEIFDRHQIEMGQRLSEVPGIEVVFDASDLSGTISGLEVAKKVIFERKSGIANVNIRIRNFVEKLNK